MHVAVVGAGALGTVYGVRLATIAGVDVSFVVRTDRAGPLSIQRVDGDRKAHAVEAPRRTRKLAPEADVALLCVSANDLGDALVGELSEHDAPIVSLTPLLPREHEHLARVFGKRLLPGMPSVTSYRPEGESTVRYWLPRVATTLVEEPSRALESFPVIDELVRALRVAGFTTRLALGTFEINAATTMAFVPLAIALDVAGSVDVLLEDPALLSLGLTAAREGGALGRAFGNPAPWAELLLRFVGPTMLKLGVSLARKRSPEGVRYVEHHFARKMHAQNLTMADEMADLAKEQGLPNAALSALAKRLHERDREARG